jgi:hypothetical protein
MHVLGDFLKRRIAPLQQRRLGAWSYTGPNDGGRVQRGDGADLTQEHLQVLVQGITGEPFVGENLILPAGIVPLCEDSDLRMVALTTLPTLDDLGLAARQLGGDPNRGVRFGGTGADPSSQEEKRRRLRRQDGSYVGEPDSKRQRTEGDPGQGRSGPAGPDSPVRPEEPSPPPQQQQPQGAQQQPQGAPKRPSGLGGRWGVKTPRYGYSG